jgi:predicted nucleic acid-binding protein
LVKVYHPEAHSSEVLSIYHSESKIFLSSLSTVEFVSASLSKLRQGEIDKTALDLELARFGLDKCKRFTVVEFCEPVLKEAEQVLLQYGKNNALRTLDALQLGFFIEYCEEDDDFVTYDKTLNKVMSDVFD